MVEWENIHFNVLYLTSSDLHYKLILKGLLFANSKIQVIKEKWYTSHDNTFWIFFWIAWFKWFFPSTFNYSSHFMFLSFFKNCSSSHYTPIPLLCLLYFVIHIKILYHILFSNWALYFAVSLKIGNIRDKQFGFLNI